MTTPTVVEVNCETGETIERPLTADELAEREAMAAQGEADRLAADAEATATAEAKASAQAKLSALGLTADEIAALSK
jgi:hypothetical protein